jgi:hypothetical protein
VFFVLALVVAAGVVWLLVYAAEPDTYYSSGVTRWEHARRSDAWILFVVSIALGVASVVGLLARAAGRAARLGPAIVGLTVVALLSFPVAWVAVTTGH